MNPRMIAPVTVIVITAAFGGYWLGHARPHEAGHASDGIDGRGRILYYRNPMGQPDTSTVPKKDPMGMDYIPVYERDVPTTPGTVAIDAAKVQRAGVRTEVVTRRTLTQEVTAAGSVRFNEAQVAVASPRVEGWIDRVHVGAIGVSVNAGDPLADIYSPDLIQTQQEYFLARDAQGQGDNSGIAALTQGALTRMKTLGLSDGQVRQLSSGKAPQRTITVFAPIAGVVSEKNAVVGQKFMPGDVLYRLADARTVWVVAKVFERDLQSLQRDARASISVQAVPERTFEGVVSFISPTLDPDTRTADVRIDVPNPDGVLRADMFATVRFRLPDREQVLTVPNSAIIDSGTRQIVLVAKEGGRFEPREVATGLGSGDYTAVSKGIEEGERVVVDSAFLIDSESNLKAALQSLTPTDTNQREPK